MAHLRDNPVHKTVVVLPVHVNEARMAIVHRKAVVLEGNLRAMGIVDPKASRRVMVTANQKPAAPATVNHRVMATVVPNRKPKVAHRAAMAKATNRARATNHAKATSRAQLRIS